MRKKNKLFAVILGILGLVCIAMYFVYNMLNKPIYTISFDTKGGSLIASITVNEGQKIEKPTDPVREGYEFLRWDYNNVMYDFNLEVKENMILTAVWKEIIIEPQKYMVTFTIDDITKTIEVEKFSDIDIEQMNFPVKKDYIIRWYLDGEIYDESKPLVKDITLEGKYVKVENYTIKFNSSGGSSVKNQVVKTDEKVKEPVNVTKSGYVLDGWYLNSEKYDFNNKVNKSFTLTAKWNEDPSIKRYNVTFDSDGGSNIESQRIIQNQTINKPTNPTKKNYIFVSWNYGDKPFDFKTKITEDIELKAIWREAQKYQVIFQLDDKTEYQKKEVLEGEKVKKPDNPSKTGYKFSGWYLDDKEFNFETKINKNITLKALFTSEATSFKVTFNTDGGNSITEQIIAANGYIINIPKNPVKVNYEFVEWQLDGKPFDIKNTPITKDITLKAIYKEKSYTVSFDTDGGTNITEQVIGANGYIINIPNNPTKENYEFVEWQLDGKTFDIKNTPITKDITLKAIYSVK